MKGIILLNGEPYENLREDSESLVYCCDGAYLWAKGKIHIDENIGDFDSLSVLPVPAPREIYPEEKDYTDGEIALHQMIRRGVNEIVFYGAGGKREDHFFGNVHLLYQAFLHGVKAKIVTNYSEMFFVRGECVLTGVHGKTVSLLPFFESAKLAGGKGLHYPIEGVTLRAGETLGISNRADTDEVTFTVTEGTVLAFLDHYKKGENGG